MAALRPDDAQVRVLQARSLLAAGDVAGARAAAQRAREMGVSADAFLGGSMRLSVGAARAAIERVNDGSGVLVITDVMGGTPSNCTLQLCEPGSVEVIAGISLPMLLRALTYRHNTLDVMIEMALAGGQNGACRVDNRVRLSPS